MRILLVTLGAPLPRNNAERWYDALIRGLVAAGHEVTVFAVFDGEDLAREVKERFPDDTYDVRCFPHENVRDWRSRIRTISRPFADLYSPRMRESLTLELARGYDVLHLEHQWSAWLAPMADPQRTLLHLHYLYALDFKGVTANGWVARAREKAWFAAERRLMRSVKHISAFSDELLAAARQANPTARTHRVPLCFDGSSFPFQGRAAGGPPTVSLIGAFGWQPSWRAADRLLKTLWPKIHSTLPEARLHLVGRKADAFAAHAQAQGYAMTGVQVFSDVPDTWTYFASSDVLLYAPPAGSGTKVKVLEAFALGTPVVTTASGAEGLNVQDGVQAGLSESDDGLIERTLRLLRDPQAAQQQRVAARNYVIDHHAPAVAVGRLEAAYDQMRR